MTDIHNRLVGEAIMAGKPEYGAIPKDVFEQFIERLESNQESSELVERLRQVILTERTLGERELREAIFPSEGQS